MRYEIGSVRALEFREHSTKANNGLDIDGKGNENASFTLDGSGGWFLVVKPWPHREFVFVFVFR